MSWYNVINELEGRTISDVMGLHRDSDEVIFTCTDGTRWSLYHDQDCCESVRIEDVIGDVEDLKSLVISAREEESEDGPLSEYDESFTWTFYVIQTSKGAVTIRWYGSSNGYYSERVDFRQMDKKVLQ